LVFKKRAKVNRIEKISVSNKLHSRPHGGFFSAEEMYVFSLHLDRSFSEKAKESLKPIIEEFILTVAKNIYSDCYWLVSAYDFHQFENIYKPVQIDEIYNYFKSLNSNISYVTSGAWHILFLLNKMNPQIFSSLKNAEPPHIGKLGTEAFDASFRAIYIENIDCFIKQNLDFYAAEGYFRDIKAELDVFYFDSRGAKVHELTILCSQDKKDSVRDCLIEVFGRHGIILDFV